MRTIKTLPISEMWVECHRDDHDEGVRLTVNIEDGQGFKVELDVDKFTDVAGRESVQLSVNFEDMEDDEVQARFILRMSKEQALRLTHTIASVMEDM